MSLAALVFLDRVAINVRAGEKSPNCLSVPDIVLWTTSTILVVRSIVISVCSNSTINLRPQGLVPVSGCVPPVKERVAARHANEGSGVRRTSGRMPILLYWPCLQPHPLPVELCTLGNSGRKPPLPCSLMRSKESKSAYIYDHCHPINPYQFNLTNDTQFLQFNNN